MDKSKQLTQVLNDCLLRLQRGETVEGILADYPAQAAELRPELEMVRSLWATRGSDTVPIQALQRSRQRLITLAERYRTEPRPPRWRVWLSRLLRLPRRPAFRLGLLLPLVLAALAAGAAAAADSALPGEPFYRVKLAVEQFPLLLNASLPDRLALELAYDQRRAEELRSAMEQRQVSGKYLLAGRLEKAQTGWQIAGIPIQMEDGENAAPAEGDYVAGLLSIEPDKPTARGKFSARLFSGRGIVEEVGENRARISGIWLDLPAASGKLAGLTPGQTVRVSLVRTPQDGWLVQRLEVLDD